MDKHLNYKVLIIVLILRIDATITTTAIIIKTKEQYCCNLFQLFFQLMCFPTDFFQIIFLINI